MYSENVLDIFKNPINAGGLQGANGVGKYVDEACGDVVKIYLKIENGTISEARFKAVGGVCTIVCASAMCSCLLDCTLEEALHIDEERICQVTGTLPKEKLYSINFSVQAVKNAINNYYSHLEKELKKGKSQINKQSENLTKEKPQITPEISERRNVSAAKAAFDALFDI